MKRILVGAAFSALVASSAYAQIPVTDGASITTQVTNQVQTIAQWTSQLKSMTNQITQMERQYSSLTGSRGLGAIMNNPSLRDYLPNNWQGVYDSVKSGGYSGLSGTGKSVYDANKIYDSCAFISVLDQRTACEARAVKGSQDKGFALDAYNAAKGRIGQIDQLMGQINSTQDPKAISELQARIQVEQANIQNEQTKLQMYEMVAAAEDKVQAQRQREIQARTWSARKGIMVQPMTFSSQ
jgi:type IV secretion system protein VirB5